MGKGSKDLIELPSCLVHLYPEYMQRFDVSLYKQEHMSLPNVGEGVADYSKPPGIYMYIL